MAAPVLNKLAKIYLTVQNGPIDGHVYEFERASITVGRGAENDIVLANDPKVSRAHAEIKAHDTKYFITNISQKNFILVNDEKTEARELRTGDIVCIGDTELQVAIKIDSAQAAPASGRVINPSTSAVSSNRTLATAPPAPAPAPYQPPQQNMYQAPPTQFQNAHSAQYQQPPASSASGSAQFKVPMSPEQMRFYGIIVVLALAGFWLFSEDSAHKGKQKIKLRTQDQIASELESSQKKLEDLQESSKKMGIDKEPFRSAQEAYLKGFRDYRNGQYSRALQHFQAALSLNPEHQLAKRYYSLAKVRFDEFVQFNMIQGRRYLERGNFRMCLSSFTQVMALLKDKNDPVYKEAQQFREECRALTKERF